MNILAQLISRINSGMNVVFEWLRGPISAGPPWLSLTVVSALLGVVMLVLFKYTSPQTAIGRVRDRIKSRLLAMKLFKDNIPVVLKCQVQVFAAAIMLLVYSIPPILVMVLPFGLILGQLGAWYQARPLEVNEQAIVVMQLSGAENTRLPTLSMDPTDAVEVMSGPVQVPFHQQVYWKIRAVQSGVHQLQFKVGDERVQKELSTGTAFMPVSMKRPSETNLGDLILYPVEPPFKAASPIRSITIEYPDRTSKFTGSGNWVITLFVISMLGAFAVKPFLNVKI
jgi:hypothetical protein